MTTPNDDQPPPVRVHRQSPGDDPATTIEPPEGERWVMEGREVQDKPAVPVSPRMIIALLVGLLVLFTAYLVLPSVIRAGRGGGGGGSDDAPGVSPSVSATVSPSTTGTPSAPTTAPVAPTLATQAAPGISVALGEDALQAWYDGTGARLVGDLDTLIDELQANIDSRDTAAVAEDCTTLNALADEALSSRPPGTAVQVAADWDDAFDRVASASDSCVTASESADETALRSVVAQARQALVFAHQAVDAAEGAF